MVISADGGFQVVESRRSPESVALSSPREATGMFELTPQSIPEVSVRIKMGESSPVRAVVKAGGKLYSVSKEVKVTIGGCGG